MSTLKDTIKDKLDHEQAEGRKDQAGGLVDRVQGNVKKNVGDLIGNEQMQAEGAAEEAAGATRQKAGDLRADAADAAEDAIDTQQAETETSLKVVVPVLSRISNHTDFDPLRLHPQVHLEFIGPGQPLPPCDLIILPGSTAVRDDLEFIRTQGWGNDIQRHLRYGGKLLGICGGLQMLGQTIHDPNGVESDAGSSNGLGYADFETTMSHEKQLRQVNGKLMPSNVDISGYEIHRGSSTGPALKQPMLELSGQADGFISADGKIAGTYLHGLFDQPTACQALLQWAGLENAKTLDIEALEQQSLDRLADAVEESIDIGKLLSKAHNWNA